MRKIYIAIFISINSMNSEAEVKGSEYYWPPYLHGEHHKDSARVEWKANPYKNARQHLSAISSFYEEIKTDSKKKGYWHGIYPLSRKDVSLLKMKKTSSGEIRASSVEKISLQGLNHKTLERIITSKININQAQFHYLLIDTLYAAIHFILMKNQDEELSCWRPKNGYLSVSSSAEIAEPLSKLISSTTAHYLSPEQLLPTLSSLFGFRPKSEPILHPVKII